MHTVAMPKSDTQIARIVKNPDAYVKTSRAMRDRKSANRRKQVLKTARGRVRASLKS